MYTKSYLFCAIRGKSADQDQSNREGVQWGGMLAVLARFPVWRRDGKV